VWRDSSNSDLITNVVNSPADVTIEPSHIATTVVQQPTVRPNYNVLPEFTSSYHNCSDDFTLTSGPANLDGWGNTGPSMTFARDTALYRSAPASVSTFGGASIAQANMSKTFYVREGGGVFRFWYHPTASYFTGSFWVYVDDVQQFEYASAGDDTWHEGRVELTAGTRVVKFRHTRASGAEGTALAIDDITVTNATEVSTSDQVKSPAVSSIFAISPSFLSSATVIQQLVVVPGSVTIVPSTIAAGTLVRTPIVEAPIIVTPSAIASGNQVNAPALSTALLISPATIAATSVVQQLVVAPGAVTVSPGSISTGNAVHEPVITTLFLILPDSVASAVTVQQPTLQTIYVVTPSEIASASVTYLPLLSATRTLLPNSIASTVSVRQPVVTAPGFTIVPGEITSASMVHEPIMSLGAAVISTGTISPGTAVHSPSLSYNLLIAPLSIGPVSLVHAPILTMIGEQVGAAIPEVLSYGAAVELLGFSARIEQLAMSVKIEDVSVDEPGFTASIEYIGYSVIMEEIE
jgi:hypothetical protein